MGCLFFSKTTPHSHTDLLTAQLQIEELTRKLRTGDLGIPPNPEDRLENTREYSRLLFLSSEQTNQIFIIIIL